MFFFIVLGPVSTHFHSYLRFFEKKLLCNKTLCGVRNGWVVMLILYLLWILSTLHKIVVIGDSKNSHGHCLSLAVLGLKIIS